MTSNEYISLVSAISKLIPTDDPDNIVNNVLGYFKYKQTNKIDPDLVQLSKSDLDKLININIDGCNDLLSIIQKTVNAKYYNNNEYYKYMIELAEINNNNINTCINSILFMSAPPANYTNYNNNINIVEINEKLAKWKQIEYELLNKNINKTSINIIKHADYIHHNVITTNYDRIISIFPIGLRNIIHAECCDKIKRLKIRGTKAEPLILQLIMNSLNENGKAVLMVPDTLLNNESKQHIDTREYLINNFNLTKVIKCSNNNSIIYFEKNTITKNVAFEELNGKLLFNISYDKLVKRNYNLYYEKYITLECNITSDSNNNCNSIKLYEIVREVNCIDIMNKTFDFVLLDYHFISIPLYLNNNKIELKTGIFSLENDHISILVHNNVLSQKYINYYFINVINNIINKYTVGKLKKLNMEELLNSEIEIPSTDKMNNIINYYNNNHNIICNNIKIIEMFTEMKRNYIDIMTDKASYIKLKDICSIDIKPTDKTTIAIQKNSKIAGAVKYHNININHSDYYDTNHYYITESNVNTTYLYFILKHNENKLNKLASITQTVNLGRSNLENFEIKDINKDIQKKIADQCSQFDHIINNTLLNIKNISNNNLFL
jgi:hypothetical protein